MLDKDDIKRIMYEYFKYRMHKDYPLCHEVACIALALQAYGFTPTDANIAQIDFFLQREHLYPEVYEARLRAVEILGNRLFVRYDCLKTEEFQSKLVLDQPLEDFEL